MNEGPTIDDRSRDELLETLRRRARNYTDDWDPSNEDVGTTVLLLFTRFGSDIIRQLNDVPDKHRVAFLNALDFDRRPPQSSRVPVTFFTSSDLDSNVVVPGGTQVIAENDDGTPVIFEIPRDSGFEATPADLTAGYTIDPQENRIVDHTTAIESDDTVSLFRGPNLQRHALYLGHTDLLNVEPGSTTRVTVRSTNGDLLFEDVEWEYFGENGNGESGWHPLELEHSEVWDTELEAEATLGEKMQRVSDRLQQLQARTAPDRDENVHELTFHVPGTITETTVSGATGRWIRGQIPGDADEHFDIEIESVRLAVDSGSRELGESRPNMVLSNDVPVTVEGEDFYPFGRLPQPPTTLYLAAEEALTKRNGLVEIRFAPPSESDESDDDLADMAADDNTANVTTDVGGPLSGPPEISWEYWNGNGWTRLGLDSDDTDVLRRPGSIAFTVPEDLEETSVSGHADYWIRARLVGGSYGSPAYELTETGARGRMIQRSTPPKFGDIIVQYGQADAAFDYLITRNNGSFRNHPSFCRDEMSTDESLRPFVPLPDETQAMYLGFDSPLREGPINLHIPMEDKAYPRDFDPGIRWEFCPNPVEESWTRLDVVDGTEGLTERVIVSLNFPSTTIAFERFGKKRHWIRARVTGNEFHHPAEVDTASGMTVPDSTTDWVDTTAPELEAIRPNTQWAYNERTITEILGESDGSPNQTFRCSNTPITDAAVWVEEGDSISRDVRRRLEREEPDRIRRETTPGRGRESIWIRWTEVPDFLDSDEDSKHYRLDRTAGNITFGDGRRGAIPPTGAENIEVTYQAGGGSDGNVDAGSITEVRTAISRIDGVTNYKPSDGGTDIETLADAVARAPRQIKTRGRAVTATDFEHLAIEASRHLAKVKCESGLNESGDRAPGWVTLLIIPRERRDRPIPSLELRQRVRDAVRDRAPVGLVGHDTSRLVVRGPDYAEISIQTTVGTEGVESITNLKHTIERRLETFFHPLTGNRDGNGWNFGQVPRLSQVITLIESTKGVRHVQDIAMTLESGGEEKIIRDPDAYPVIGRDEMISSGTHDVRVVLEDYQ